MNYLTPDVVAAACAQAGANKAAFPVHKIALLGILAGAYIAFGANLATVVTAVWPVEWSGLGSLFYGLTFSLGLVLVILCGAELFTGNNMFLMLSTLTGQTRWRQLAFNWVLVFIANFIGALVLVLLLYAANYYFTDAGLTAQGIKAVTIAKNKLSLTWGQAFVRGILCNWLVCLAVWLAFSAKDNIGRIVGIVLPITAFVACGFEHSVANMFFIPIGLLIADTVPQAVAAVDTLGGTALELLTWGRFFTANLIPVALGNIIGGAGFVALIYWLAYLKKGRA